MLKIRVQLVEGQKVHRSFDTQREYTWLEATSLYDRMQRIMGGKKTDV